MNTEELKIKISEYFDGELSKAGEALLFSQLADDEEAREYFKDCSRIRNVIQESFEEMPNELEERILLSVGDVSEKQNNSFFRKWNYTLAAYAAAAVLLIVSIFFYTSKNEYKQELETTIEKVNTQYQMIQLLYNSLPAAEVEGKLDYNVTVEQTKL
jgi:negative regulator of sigma E activity